MKNVQFTADNDLCSSCGICKAVCSRGAISYHRQNGMFFPKVDSARCVDCGLCTSICPGLGTVYSCEDELTAVYGKYELLQNAWSKNPQIRHVSASGGVVSTMISALLELEMYDVAFCVDTYCYQDQLKTKAIKLQDIGQEIENTSFPKSRYLPVSHEDTIAFIKENKNQKAIIVGTSCAIQGIRKVLKTLRKDENQYLLIGLFCDKVFNYNVYQYFVDQQRPSDKKVMALHFKNKESGGWPGNMKYMFSDGSFCYADKSERTDAKDYFIPERCLYCVDKLNVQADISLGDNYTNQDSSALGSNTVFVRTMQGLQAWKAVENHIESHPVTVDKVRMAQYLDGRLNNLYFAVLKETKVRKQSGEKIVLNKGLRLKENEHDYLSAWKRSIKRLHAGALYLEKPGILFKQKRLDKILRNKKHPLTILFRVADAVSRRIGEFRF